MSDYNLFLSDQQLLDVLAVTNHPTAIHIGEDALIQVANDAMLRVWGKDKSVIGKSLGDALPELKGQPFLDMFKKVWHEGITISGTDTAADLVVDGRLQTFYFDFEYRAIKDTNGKTFAILHQATDITERILSKQREQNLIEQLTATNEEISSNNEELAAINEELFATTEELTISNDRLRSMHDTLLSSESRFRQLVDQAPIAICVIRAYDLRVEIVNDNYVKLVGKHRTDLEQRNIWEVVPEAEAAFAPVMNGVIETGIPFVANEAEVVLVRDGLPEKVYLNFVYEPLKDADGTVSAVLVVAVEVTELVASRQRIEDAEERVRLATEAAEIGTFELNVANRDLITSSRFNKIFGYNTSVTSHMVDRSIYPEDRELRHAAHEKAMISGSLFYEARIILPDETMRWMRATGKVFFDRAHKPVRMLGTVQDITDFKQLQQQKDDFISIASHELKTPITSLKASLQLLDKMKENPSKEFMPRLIAQARKSIQRVSALVEDLLNVSRLQQTEIQLNKTGFVLADLVRNCCETLLYHEGQALKLTGDLDLLINADEHRIEQVIINLVNNAIKYAPGTDQLLIDITREQDFVKVAVTDKGPGVPADRIAHLFDRYYRVEGQGYNSSGLGLGLYISSEIIKHHGGQIGVESELGAGATFYFTLPL
ncbi:PAS domain-containing sensor histidine kinase [Mucilaginibacter sp. RS28]|uniref:histidine kinase n=1 Tax=Mucilaginibacter straminoryzae TaxID=2932774 RepID=A0A9X1WZY7_9SPHI|nr:ATP-binding protein [Mucilaginibacter straminoryzae]MCJ8208629.1 PAS domain-containing sensor histidine kinase [Mucilaginibacter straminoryzae]